jgi:transposase
MTKADLQKQKKTRVRRSPEMIAELIFEAERKGNVADLCRREGIAPNLFYRWKAKFRQAGIEELKQMKRGRKSGTGADQEKLDLQAENEKLRAAVCEQAIELLLLKKNVHSDYMDR